MQEPCNLLEEADEYVKSVMSSQCASASVTVKTPLPSGRKRFLSAPDVTESEVKKARNDTSDDERLTVKAKRNLMNMDTPLQEEGKQQNESKALKVNTKSKNNKESKRGKGEIDNSLIEEAHQIMTRAEVHRDADTEIKDLLKKMTASMNTMQDIMNKRMDMLENKIDQSEKKITDKLTDKVTKIIDKRVNTETARIRKEIEDKLSDLRSDFNNDLVQINRRIEERADIGSDQGTQSTGSNQNTTDLSLNVVIRNLPETINENVMTKVDAMIKDGLKIRDVTVASAVRKVSRAEHRAGVVIAKFQTSDDKKKVMTSKKALKEHRSYDNVYINHDQTAQERRMASSMRTLVEAVKRGESNITVRGTRIISSSDNDSDGRGNRDHNNTRGGNPRDRQPAYRRDNTVRSDYGVYNKARRDSHDNRDIHDIRDNRQTRQRDYINEQSADDDQGWRTARRDGRHNGRYSRQGNYRRNNY